MQMTICPKNLCGQKCSDEWHGDFPSPRDCYLSYNLNFLSFKQVFVAQTSEVLEKKLERGCKGISVAYHDLDFDLVKEVSSNQ